MKVHGWILGAAMLAAPPVLAQESAPAAPSPAKPAVNVNAPRPAMSTEQLLAMRNAMMLRVAVYDSVEKTWREPTASEHAQLSQGLSASGAPRMVALSNGGMAIKGDAAELSFLTVELQSDGTLTMGHAGAAESSLMTKVPTPRLKAAPKKGGQDVE